MPLTSQQRYEQALAAARASRTVREQVAQAVPALRGAQTLEQRFTAVASAIGAVTPAQAAESGLGARIFEDILQRQQILPPAQARAFMEQVRTAHPSVIAQELRTATAAQGGAFTFPSHPGSPILYDPQTIQASAQKLGVPLSTQHAPAVLAHEAGEVASHVHGATWRGGKLETQYLGAPGRPGEFVKIPGDPAPMLGHASRQPMLAELRAAKALGQATGGAEGARQAMAEVAEWRVRGTRAQVSPGQMYHGLEGAGQAVEEIETLARRVLRQVDPQKHAELFPGAAGPQALANQTLEQRAHSVRHEAQAARQTGPVWGRDVRPTGAGGLSPDEIAAMQSELFGPGSAYERGKAATEAKRAAFRERTGGLEVGDARIQLRDVLNEAAQTTEDKYARSVLKTWASDINRADPKGGVLQEYLGGELRAGTAPRVVSAGREGVRLELRPGVEAWLPMTEDLPPQGRGRPVSSSRPVPVEPGSTETWPTAKLYETAGAGGGGGKIPPPVTPGPPAPEGPGGRGPHKRKAAKTAQDMAADIRRMMPENPASIAKTAAEEQLLTRMDAIFGARQQAVAKSLEGKTALAFDLETTHRQIEQARIAEVGAVKRLPTGEIADPLDLVVRPPIKPTPEAYNIWKQGGLTWERVAAQGQSFEEVAEQILRYMNIGAEGRAAEGTVFIGHNIARVTREAPAVRAGVNINLMAAREKAVIQVLSQGYDLPVLAEEMARVGHAFNVEAQAAVMDTQVFLKDALLRHERSKDVYRNTLDELAETFGIAFKHHNARQDAQTSLHAVLKFAGGGYPELRALNLQNLGLQELVDEIGFERAAELISAQGQPTGMESMLAPRDVDAAVGPAPTTTRAETATLRTQKARTASKVEQQALTRAEGAAAGRLGMISKHPLAIGAAAGFGIFLVSQLMDRSQRDQRRMTPEGYAGLLQSMHMRVSGTQSKIPDLRTKLSRLMPVGAWAGPDVHWNQGSRREAMAHIHA